MLIKNLHHNQIKKIKKILSLSSGIHYRIHSTNIEIKIGLRTIELYSTDLDEIEYGAVMHFDHANFAELFSKEAVKLKNIGDSEFQAIESYIPSENRTGLHTEINCVSIIKTKGKVKTLVETCDERRVYGVNLYPHLVSSLKVNVREALSEKCPSLVDYMGEINA